MDTTLSRVRTGVFRLSPRVSFTLERFGAMHRDGSQVSERAAIARDRDR